MPLAVGAACANEEAQVLSDQLRVDLPQLVLEGVPSGFAGWALSIEEARLLLDRCWVEEQLAPDDTSTICRSSVLRSFAQAVAPDHLDPRGVPSVVNMATATAFIAEARLDLEAIRASYENLILRQFWATIEGPGAVSRWATASLSAKLPTTLSTQIRENPLLLIATPERADLLQGLTQFRNLLGDLVAESSPIDLIGRTERESLVLIDLLRANDTEPVPLLDEVAARIDSASARAFLDTLRLVKDTEDDDDKRWMASAPVVSGTPLIGPIFEARRLIDERVASIAIPSATQVLIPEELSREIVANCEALFAIDPQKGAELCLVHPIVQLGIAQLPAGVLPAGVGATRAGSSGGSAGIPPAGLGYGSSVSDPSARLAQAAGERSAPLLELGDTDRAFLVAALQARIETLSIQAAEAWAAGSWHRLASTTGQLAAVHLAILSSLPDERRVSLSSNPVSLLARAELEGLRDFLRQQHRIALAFSARFPLAWTRFTADNLGDEVAKVETLLLQDSIDLTDVVRSADLAVLRDGLSRFEDYAQTAISREIERMAEVAPTLRATLLALVRGQPPPQAPDEVTNRQPASARIVAIVQGAVEPVAAVRAEAELRAAFDLLSELSERDRAAIGLGPEVDFRSWLMSELSDWDLARSLALVHAQTQVQAIPGLDAIQGLADPLFARLRDLEHSLLNETRRRSAQGGGDTRVVKLDAVVGLSARVLATLEGSQNADRINSWTLRVAAGLWQEPARMPPAIRDEYRRIYAGQYYSAVTGLQALAGRANGLELALSRATSAVSRPTIDALSAARGALNTLSDRLIARYDFAVERGILATEDGARQEILVALRRFGGDGAPPGEGTVAPQPPNPSPGAGGGGAALSPAEVVESVPLLNPNGPPRGPPTQYILGLNSDPSWARDIYEVEMRLSLAEDAVMRLEGFRSIVLPPTFGREQGRGYLSRSALQAAFTSELPAIRRVQEEPRQLGTNEAGTTVAYDGWRNAEGGFYDFAREVVDFRLREPVGGGIHFGSTATACPAMHLQASILRYDGATSMLEMIDGPRGDGRRVMQYGPISPQTLKALWLFASDTQGTRNVAISIGWSGRFRPLFGGQPILLDPFFVDTAVGWDLLFADTIPFALDEAGLPNGLENPIYREFAAAMAARRDLVEERARQMAPQLVRRFPGSTLLEQLGLATGGNELFEMIALEPVTTVQSRLRQVITSLPVGDPDRAIYEQLAQMPRSTALLLILNGISERISWGQLRAVWRVMTEEDPTRTVEDGARTMVAYLAGSGLAVLADADPFTVCQGGGQMEIGGQMRYYYAYDYFTMDENGIQTAEETVTLGFADGRPRMEFVPVADMMHDTGLEAAANAGFKQLVNLIPQLDRVQGYARIVSLLRWALYSGAVSGIDFSDLVGVVARDQSIRTPDAFGP